MTNNTQSTIMITRNDIYRKIKEMSAEQWIPRPVIPVSHIAERLTADKDYLMPFLTDLHDMKLITFDDPAKLTVKLTPLGSIVTRHKP